MSLSSPREQAAATLDHSAFVYGSREELVDVLAPMIRAALEDGDDAFVAMASANVAPLRERLGGDAGRVRIEDTATWEAHPFRRLQAVRRMVGELPPGRALLALCEPLWNGSQAAQREWARYESVINLALADAPLRFVCLYDGSSLSAEVLEYAGATHPECLARGAAGPTARYLDPFGFDSRRPEPSPPTAHSLSLEGHELREALSAHARAAGLGRERVDKLALAASEIAANARLHGRPPAHGWVWAQSAEIVCRVTDAGAGIADPAVGWLLPPRGATGGWGLPLARDLCDAVEIAHREGATSVTLYMGRDGDVD